MDINSILAILNNLFTNQNNNTKAPTSNANNTKEGNEIASQVKNDTSIKKFSNADLGYPNTFIDSRKNIEKQTNNQEQPASYISIPNNTSQTSSFSNLNGFNISSLLSLLGQNSGFDLHSILNNLGGNLDINSIKNSASILQTLFKNNKDSLHSTSDNNKKIKDFKDVNDVDI